MKERRTLMIFQNKYENRFYRYGFNLNASHSFLNNNVHSHTFKITIYIKNVKDVELLFKDYESKIEEFLADYRGKYLNDLDPFDKVSPTLENMAIVFYSRILKILEKSNLKILKLEIGDGYTTNVAISNVLITGDNKRIFDNSKVEQLKQFLFKKYDIKENKNILKFKIEKLNFDLKKIEDFDNLLYENFINNY